MKKYYIYFLVFTAGFIVMTYEIVASRILAPYIGTSIIAWTSIIGVILASLSVGNYWGGMIADRSATNRGLGNIFLAAGLWALGLYFFKNNLLEYIYLQVSDLRLLSLLMSVYAFSFPNVLFGMVSPYSIKLSLKSTRKTGEISGKIFALSTLGSIVGTFVTGFYLISFIGSNKILLVITILSILGAIVVYMSSKSTRFISIFSLLLVTLIIPEIQTAQENRFGVYEKDSLYSKIIVLTQKEKITNRPVLRLETGCISCLDGCQSLMYSDEDNDLAAEYTKYFRLGGFLLPDVSKALMIGGGAYSFPKEFIKTFEDATIDVVEIDEEITKTAKRYFNLKDDSRMNIIHQGARDFINRNEKKYDVVYQDIIVGDSSIPFQITTVEFMKKIDESLEDQGLMILNMALSISGDGDDFFRSELKTLKEIFPSVYVFDLRKGKNEYKDGNVIIVAFKEETNISKLEKLVPDYYLSNLYTKEVPLDVPILTDDFAPVEYYAVQRISNVVNNGRN